MHRLVQHTECEDEHAFNVRSERCDGIVSVLQHPFRWPGLQSPLIGSERGSVWVIRVGSVECDRTTDSGAARSVTAVCYWVVIGRYVLLVLLIRKSKMLIDNDADTIALTAQFTGPAVESEAVATRHRRHEGREAAVAVVNRRRGSISVGDRPVMRH